MNTTFFQKASENKRSISWGDIFSDVWKKHRKDQRTALLTKGMGLPYSSAKPNAFRLAKTMAVCPCIDRGAGIICINWDKLCYLSGLWNASHVMSAPCFCSAIICNVILLGNEYSGEHFYL